MNVNRTSVEEMAQAIRHAAQTLNKGGVVSIPTETVYGLAADARNATALRRIFAIKGRPANHPLIVHLSRNAPLNEWACNVPDCVELLATHFWPGPLTLILRKASTVLDEITGGYDTVALRIPGHPITLALLDLVDGGLAAPSANRFSRVSPTCAEHVQSDLGDEVDYILDGGPCKVGVESTILDLTGPYPRILRPGPISAEMLEVVLHTRVTVADAASAAVPCPGQHPLHYSIDADVQVVDAENITARTDQLVATGRRPVVLAAEVHADLLPGAMHLPCSSDPECFARDLYQNLRLAERCGQDIVLVVPPAANGIGFAVADRLRRAGGRPVVTGVHSSANGPVAPARDDAC